MNQMQMFEGLSYDDILLLPGYADFLPSEARVEVELHPRLRLNIPILSAAMDTVTEKEMAIALALEGGLGVIHRNLSPEEQAGQVAAVKRYLNWIIESPITVRKGQTVREAKALMQQYNISGLPVVDEKGTLCGILTGRDLRFVKDERLKVEEVMTPDPVVERGRPTIDQAQEAFDRHKVEKLPLVDETGKLIGLVTVKDIEKHQKHPRAALDSHGRLLVGAAVSPGDFRRRLPLLVENRVDVVVIDTAHGHTRNVVETVKAIKKEWDIPVIAGNVATVEGTKALIEAGADMVKVGIGPGSICTTRIVAGIGVPQFSAVLQCAEEAAKHGVPVIADGGIKYSGDIVKAIGAGAHAVMIGNLFAGLKEAPGKEIIYEGRIFKSYRGMGSLGAIREGSGDRYQIGEGEEPVPEGVEGRVPYKGELAPYLHQLVSGLKKGMGYCGCRTLEDLRSYRRFVKITHAALRESHVHDVTVTQEPPNYSR
ncbi:inosine-5'-monophosphate dehydrogenase [Spirochaeta thermophila DSM 6578]|uniref:Inosine-5'-monophosphate dehydrogenase n=1 Tax=Winmispira thermophila (strain ATCC 700085 / DSM 6578 / Z-1203) TaxID=869211 RepID=G0GD06_WINT7|nr:IMP dehydrogenase [Spirochaeta thermophila]AEJ61298.1 inosine-5'-monophosphate dehydrogenase [Spirochaeta thermophila DSM 6578]